jgi:hypothetical protein
MQKRTLKIRNKSNVEVYVYLGAEDCIILPVFR